MKTNSQPGTSPFNTKGRPLREDPPRVRATIAARIPTRVGEFRLHHFTNSQDDKEHLALVMGQATGDDVLVRVHSECFTGDVLGSLRCDCGEQLEQAMAMIAAEGRGVVIYLRQEGRGIGLEEKLRAYNLQDQGYDTVEANLRLGHQADEREYWAAAGILDALNVRSIRLLTNNPAKVEHLTALGVDIRERIPLEPTVTEENAFYLATKARRMRHILASTDAPAASSANGDTEAPPYAGRQTAIPQAVREQIDGLRIRAADHFRRTGLPFVTLSYAQSLDGSITATPGRPFVISGQRSLLITHALRAAHDAILVGVDTVLADDPRLDVRLIEGRNPQAVILDSRLRTPPDARIFAYHERTWIATGDGDAARRAALEQAGARIAAVGTNGDGRVELSALLARLGKAGIQSVMVEGGARVLSAFLQQRLAHFAVVTISPFFLGGYPAVQWAGERPAAPPRLRAVTRTDAGEDLILWGELHYPSARQTDNART